MARRSPMNERYQKNTAPAGKTRRSAASAKPKRDMTPSSTSAKTAKKTATREPLVINPPTEEYKRWRRIWWFLLLGSVAFTAASMAVRKWLPDQPTVGAVLLGLGYLGIFSALYLDFTKLRRMRNEWMQEQKSGKSAGKTGKTDKS